MNIIDQSEPSVKGKITIVKKAPPPVPGVTAASMPAKTKAIATLVADLTKSDPFSFEGHQWAKRSQDWWVEKLGFSVETFRRHISKPPFVRNTVIDVETGNKVTLVRIGEPGPKSKRHLQNILSSIWREKTGLRTTPKQYGQMAGMVDHWGEKAPVIFKLALTQWDRFMSGVKIQIALLGDEGKPRYFEHPATSVILRFHAVATEMYLMDQQEKHGLNADLGGLWFG
ncbi:hypothetical protein N7379_02780 [Rhizobium pusense]|uniref:hypothetical protein n=1 Tax=Agrobacterium pusense TaxID=648995 RepID=UPI00244B92DA|nr:hypothetical protein [Agrobacterium pusense]MDH0113390.1 hypothetical protein [Agrobacterium pusense]